MPQLTQWGMESHHHQQPKREDVRWGRIDQVGKLRVLNKSIINGGGGGGGGI